MVRNGGMPPGRHMSQLQHHADPLPRAGVQGRLRPGPASDLAAVLSLSDTSLCVSHRPVTDIFVFIYLCADVVFVVSCLHFHIQSSLIQSALFSDTQKSSWHTVIPKQLPTYNHKKFAYLRWLLAWRRRLYNE